MNIECHFNRGFNKYFVTISIQLGINCSKIKEARGGRSQKIKLSGRNVKTRSWTKSSRKRQGNAWKPRVKVIHYC